MNTLYLTADEQKQFSGLADPLKEGWTVEEDVIEYEDSDHRREIRLRTMNIQDPWLKELQQKAMQINTSDGIMKLVNTVDIKECNDSDLAELLYALGPNILSALLRKLMAEHQDDEGIEQVAALSSMRHLLFGKK